MEVYNLPGTENSSGPRAPSADAFTRWVRSDPAPAKTPRAKDAPGPLPLHAAYKTPTGRPPHLLHHVGGSVSSPGMGSSKRGVTGHSTRPLASHRGVSQAGTPLRGASRDGVLTPATRGLYTPSGVSVHQFSGACRTPQSLVNHNTPGRRAVWTHGTPGGRGVVNPFETELLDTLCEPLLSPNVFTQTSTPHSDRGTARAFKWSIEHLAELQPADIENSPPSHLMLSSTYDVETEARAQRAIDTFFMASDGVVPSPWSDVSVGGEGRRVLPQTPATPATPDAVQQMALLRQTQVAAAVAALDDADREEDAAVETLGRGDADVEMTSQHVGCQTALSLPNNFDLEQMLGEYYSRDPGDENEALSNSSLRRKLFFHGDIGTPLSPVRVQRSQARPVPMEFVCASSPRVSPVKPCVTPDRRFRSSATPGSAAQFSSSPIARGAPVLSPPLLRRCSTAVAALFSPQMSPIVTAAATRKSHSASSGEFSSPLCLPLQGTPSSGSVTSSAARCARIPALNSPGISPIRGPATVDSDLRSAIGQTRHGGAKRKSPDTQHTSPYFRHNDQSEVGDDEKQDGGVSASAFPPLRLVPIYTARGPDKDTEDFQMDFEPSSAQEETFVSGEFARRSVRFASSTRVEFPELPLGGDTGDQTTVGHVTVSSTCHDTGYNTNSLQLSNQQDVMAASYSNMAASCSTNQDAAFPNRTRGPVSSVPVTSQDPGNVSSASLVAHTDLTAQFGSIPVSLGHTMDVSEGYDSDVEDLENSCRNQSRLSCNSSGGSSLILKEKFPPDPLCEADCEEEEDDPQQNGAKTVGDATNWNEDKILQRARQMLANLEDNKNNNGCAEVKAEGTRRMIRKTARIRDVTSRVDDVITTPRNPAAMATPYREQFQRLGVVPDNAAARNVMASDVAQTLLRRAEEDVTRFCCP